MLHRKLRQRRRTSKVRWGGVVTGLTMLLVAVAVLALVGWSWPAQPLGARVTLPALFGLMAVFGIEMLVQGLLGRPASAEWLHRILSAISARLSVALVAYSPLILGLLVGMQAVATRDRAQFESAALVVLAWISVYGQLFFHELGHLLAVQRLGFVPLKVVGGPFMFVPSDRGWRLKPNRNWFHLLVGAVFFELPPENQSPEECLIIAGAGPAATGISLAIMFFLDAKFQPTGMWGGFLDMSMLSAGWSLVINLLPFRVGAMESDGSKIRAALREMSRRRTGRY